MSGLYALFAFFAGLLLTQAFPQPETSVEFWLLALGWLGVVGGVGWLVGGAILAVDEVRQSIRSMRKDVREIRRAQLQELERRLM